MRWTWPGPSFYQISDEPTGQLQARGLQVVQVSLTEFLKAEFGAAKYLVLRLTELDVAQAIEKLRCERSLKEYRVRVAFPLCLQ